MAAKTKKSPKRYAIITNGPGVRLSMSLRWAYRCCGAVRPGKLVVGR